MSHNTNPTHYGDFRIENHGQVMYIKASGIFNESVAEAYLHSFYRLGQKLCHQAWAIYGDATELEIGTPETMRLFSESTKWSDDNNLTNIAIVVGSSAMTKMELTTNIVEQHDKTMVEFFNDADKAQTWLRSFGYPIDPKIQHAVETEWLRRNEN